MDNCTRCGRKITRPYIWQDQIYGSSCIKKMNPWHSNPAETLLLVAEALIQGDMSLLPLVPAIYRRHLTNKSRIRDAWNYSGCFGGSHAFNLAILVRNDIARTGQETFNLADLIALRQD